MTDKPKPPVKPSVADVTQPGKSAPAASSRPVIVGNKPMVQDPMVNDRTASTPAEPSVAVRRSGPQVITPLPGAEKSAAEAGDATAEPSVTEQGAAESPQASAGEVADGQLIAPAQAESSEAPPGSSRDASGKSSSIVDAVVGQASKAKDKNDDKKQAELEKRQAEIEKLIEEKKYFVSTSQGTKKQRKTRWAALLLIVLLLVGAYLAIDAQVIKNDIQLPYEFFKEEQQPGEAPAASTGLQQDSQQSDPQSDSPSQGAADSQASVQVRARDADRKNELKILQSRLESYFNDNGSYPTGADWAAEIGATEDELTDPSGEAYSYRSVDGQAYTLRVQLENESDPEAVDGYYVLHSVNQL